MVWDNTLERTGVDTQSTQQLHGNVFFCVAIVWAYDFDDSRIAQLLNIALNWTFNGVVGIWDVSDKCYICDLTVFSDCELRLVVCMVGWYLSVGCWVGRSQRHFWLIPTQTPISAALSEARFVQLPPRLGWLPRASFDRANHSSNLTTKRCELWRNQKWVVWETQESLRRNSMPREWK